MVMGCPGSSEKNRRMKIKTSRGEFAPAVLPWGLTSLTSQKMSAGAWRLKSSLKNLDKNK